MGYIKDLREDITKRLEALDTQCREDVQAFLNVIANAVLDSYKNGQKSVQAEKREERKGTEEKRPQRAWKKRPAQGA